jgi:hypothetical protein
MSGVFYIGLGETFDGDKGEGLSARQRYRSGPVRLGSTLANESFVIFGRASICGPASALPRSARWSFSRLRYSGIPPRLCSLLRPPS